MKEISFYLIDSDFYNFIYLIKPSFTIMNILLVEDDSTLATSLKKNLSDEGYYTVIAETGTKALELIREFEFDLILLDWKLPDISGIDICRIIRKENTKIPIILLTILSSISNKVEAFRIGADDYITKPFNLNELLARIKAVMRRYMNNSTQINYQEITLNLTTRKVFTHKGEIDLTDREFELLRYLIIHKGEIISKEDLFRDVWKIPFNPYTNVIESTIKNLRKKLEKHLGRKLIRNVYGEGYTII